MMVRSCFNSAKDSGKSFNLFFPKLRFVHCKMPMFSGSCSMLLAPIDSFFTFATCLVSASLSCKLLWFKSRLRRLSIFAMNRGMCLIWLCSNSRNLRFLHLLMLLGIRFKPLFSNVMDSMSLPLGKLVSCTLQDVNKATINSNSGRVLLNFMI